MNRLCRHSSPLLAALLAALPAALLACACGPSARAQSLVTTDGKSLQGPTALHGDQLTIAPPAAAPTAVDLANVLYATFQMPRPATLGAGYLGPLSAHTLGRDLAPADAVFTRGMYAVSAAGGQFNAEADAGHLLTQACFGDCDITVRLCDLTAGSAGMTLRESLEPAARHVSLLVSGGRLLLVCRADAGPPSQVDLGAVTLPLWLRLTRTESLFRAFTSPDGANWSQRAGAPDNNQSPAPPIAVAFPPGALAGLVLAADKARANACFDELVIRADSPQPPAAAPRAAQFHAWPHEAFLQGVLLRQGTFLAGARVDQEGTPSTLTWQNKQYPIAAAQLARWQKQTLSPATFAHLPLTDASGKPLAGTGVLLASGDFLQGGITAFDKDHLEVSSIVFGLRSLTPEKFTAVAFHPVEAPPPGFRVLLADGSLLMARALAADSSGAWSLDEAALGKITVAAGEVLSLQRTSGTIRLADLPLQVQGPANADVDALTCLGRAGSFWLGAEGAILEGGLISPAGTTITLHPPAGARHLQARLAVPARLPPEAQVQFVVTASGAELYRSPPLTSRSASIPVWLELSGAAALALRVELARPTSVPAYGLWGNPLLVP